MYPFSKDAPIFLRYDTISAIFQNLTLFFAHFYDLKMAHLCYNGIIHYPLTNTTSLNRVSVNSIANLFNEVRIIEIGTIALFD